MRLVRLDGIRAVAILMVMARHAFTLPYGWAGVDLFFVLSGFLITGILRRERQENSFWRPFYCKRATRILPPMVVAIAAAYFLFPIPWRVLWPYYAFFAANFADVFHSNEIFSLGVLWSLAVEEQFYFAWPFAIRLLKRRQLIWLLSVIIAIEPLLRGMASPYFHSYSLSPIRFITFFRLDGLAAGSLLSLLLEEERAKAWLKTWSLRVLIALLALFALLSRLVPSFHMGLNEVSFDAFGFGMVAWIAAFFVAYVIVEDQSWTSRLLSNPVFVFIGVISYGMYLSHIVIILELQKYLQQHHSKHASLIVVVVTLPTTIGISWLSFRFFERPITKWGQRRAAQMNASNQATSAAV